MTRTKRYGRRHRSVASVMSSLIIVAAVIIVAGVAWKLNAYGGRSAVTEVEQCNLLKVVTNPDLDATPLSYSAMEISFNPRMHQPNWVSWELTRDETDGLIPRYNKFMCDDAVTGCAEPDDYNYSGYDRGHMAPAGDMKWDRRAMEETFLMTNICPQAKALNTGAWKRLEQKCRIWAQVDSAIIIVCGPILTDPIREYIGDNRVAVPRRFFKVVLSPYVENPRAIGFIMNNDYVEGGMQSAAVSVDEVERMTGHDFFSELPDEIENEVESQCDFYYWSTLKSRKK